jgi:hypothetical protein
MITLMSGGDRLGLTKHWIGFIYRETSTDGPNRSGFGSFSMHFRCHLTCAQVRFDFPAAFSVSGPTLKQYFRLLKMHHYLQMAIHVYKEEVNDANTVSHVLRIQGVTDNAGVSSFNTMPKRRRNYHLGASRPFRDTRLCVCFTPSIKQIEPPILTSDSVCSRTLDRHPRIQ